MAFSSSPAMKPELFVGGGSWADAQARQSTMTVGGTVNKAFTCLSLCVLAATGSWALVDKTPSLALPVLLGCGIAAFIVALVTMAKPNAAFVTAPLYAVLQGGFVGAVSLYYAYAMAGTKVGGATGNMVVVNAALITFAIMGAMLGLYKLGIITATRRFKAVMAVIGAGIAVYSLVMLGLSLFGVNVGMFYTGPIGVVIAVGILVFSAFCLIVDFGMIEEGVAHGAPRRMEWYGAFALVVTLVWIYLNVLRVLALLNKRD